MEHALAVVAACLMLAVGLEMLGLPIRVGARGGALVQSTLRRLLGGVLASRSPAAPLAMLASSAAVVANARRLARATS